MITLGVSPMPNQTISSGAIAIFGVVCSARMMGYSVFRSTCETSSSTASATPISDPMKNPTRIGIRVSRMCGR
nr:hypothetical protein [Leucobacter muris]